MVAVAHILCSLIVLLLILGGCAPSQPPSPLQPLAGTELPGFYDDQERGTLLRAIRESLQYLESIGPDRPLALGTGTVSSGRVAATLLFFQDLLEKTLTPAGLDRAIKEHFTVYRAAQPGTGKQQHPVLVTGYYQPVYAGSLTRTPIYRYPLYRIPNNLALQRLPGGEGRSIGRLEGDRLVPYWSRAEIENRHRLDGQELVWLRDPLDVFFLHVQGSGLIRLPDGAVRGVRYALKNGRPYRSIGKYLVDTGRISLEEASLDTIRAYLAAHPDMIREVLQHNPSYIFFDWNRDHQARGSLNRILTAGRSIAADQSYLPGGGLAFLVSRQPVVRNGRIIYWKSLHRFVLIQDSGSAIRGPARVDLFWGTGPEAGLAAGRMKEVGELYLLLLKQKPQPRVTSRRPNSAEQNTVDE